MNLQVKQRIPLKIKRMGINGEGIGFYKKTLVFVPGALKGEEVFCQVVSVRRNFVQAKLLKINKPSKFRVEPECGVYKECGGCQLMHLRYDKQLEFKTDLLGQALKKFKTEHFESYDIRPTIGMKEPRHYRAKLQFQTRSFGGSVKAGLFAEGSHRLVNIDNCVVQDKLTQAIMNQVVVLLDKYKLPIYDERKISGVRTVMIRRALGSNQVQLIFVTSKSFSFAKLVKELTAIYPEIVTIAINYNYCFELSPRAFYQLNPQQTEVLYGQAVKALDVDKNDNLIDAYCGVGTIGLAFANKVKDIRGMDIIPEAIDDARENAEALGLENYHYEVGKAEDIIPRWYKEGYRADALIVDPPRTGLDDKLLQTILEYVPEKMVYVSCNVSTLARDLVSLTQAYEVNYIQSVDMFPHTARTEAVVKLTRKM